MTTRAGRAFTTLHDKIRRLEAINKDLLEACKAAYQECDDDDYLGSDLAKTLQQAISKAEGI